MISHTTYRFWELLASLPQNIQKQARQAYVLFAKDPYHPSLNFKRIHATRPIYSVRITRNYRAVGIEEENEIIWF